MGAAALMTVWSCNPEASPWGSAEPSGPREVPGSPLRVKQGCRGVEWEGRWSPFPPSGSGVPEPGPACR